MINDPKHSTMNQNILLKCFDARIECVEYSMTSLKELEEYLTANDYFESDSDILNFWMKHEKLFPTLVAIVQDTYIIYPYVKHYCGALVLFSR